VEGEGKRKKRVRGEKKNFDLVIQVLVWRVWKVFPADWITPALTHLRDVDQHSRRRGRHHRFSSIAPVIHRNAFDWRIVRRQLGRGGPAVWDFRRRQRAGRQLGGRGLAGERNRASDRLDFDFLIAVRGSALATGSSFDDTLSRIPHSRCFSVDS